MTTNRIAVAAQGRQLTFLCFLLIALIATGFLFPSAVVAQDDEGGPPKPPPTFIELTSVKVSKVKDSWQLRVAGKGTDLPAGCVIDFQIRWRTFVIYDFKITLDGSRRIDEKIDLKGLTGAISGAQLRSEIQPSSQSRKVQDAMAKDPKKYPIETAPWKQSFWRQKFDIGSAADVEKAKKTAQAFFLAKTKEVLGLQRAFEKARTEAIDGARFQKSGKFDGASWQSYVERDCREKIRKLQKEIKDSSKSLDMIPQSRDLKYLVEIVNAVAKRSYDRSISLYRELGLNPDVADMSPKDIDVNCRSTKLSSLQKTVERLFESQQIDMSQLSG
jgi:hypothetical protein